MKKTISIILIAAGVILLTAMSPVVHREKENDVQKGVRRRVLVQYEDSGCYVTDNGNYRKMSDPQWNSYVLMADDQINRPDEIYFYFGQDIEHQVFAVNQELQVIWTKEFGKGEHCIELDENVACVSFAVADEEEADFYLEGTGMYTQVETPFTGKKISVLGDSLSAYRKYIPQHNHDFYNDAAFNVQSMWWAVLAEKTGMEICVVNASGGSGVTLLDENEDSAHPLQGNSERCMELSTPQEDPDEILVLLGGNDYLRGVPVEEIEEEYLEMLSKMKTAYPEAAIHVCTYHFFDYISEDQLAELNGMIEHVAALGDVGLIDIRDEEIGKSGEYKYLFEDHLHLNERGQLLLGNTIARKLLRGEK